MAFDERGEIIRGMPSGREIIPPGHIANMGDQPPDREDTAPGVGAAPAEDTPDTAGEVPQEKLLEFFADCWEDARIDKRRL